MVALLMFNGTPSAPVRTVSSQAPSCEQVVTDAYQVTEQLCQKTGRNEACYGHISLNATPQPQVDNFTFAAEGDIVNVADVQTLRLSAMDPVTNTWGVALLRFQANIANDQPNKNATLLLFGNVELESQFKAPTSAMDVTVTSNGNVNIRQEPSTSATIIGSIKAGETATVTGRLEDSSWLRVQLPNSQVFGWISRSLVANADDSDLAGLDVVASAPQYGPMQAFYFSSNNDGEVCPEMPESGFVIQTPEGIAEITLLINEVDIQIGSTVYFRAEPGGVMTISVVEGMVHVKTFDQMVRVPAGTEVTIPLDENMKPAGPPSQPYPYDPAEMNLLPIGLLERQITIHKPLTEDEITTILSSPDGEESGTPADCNPASASNCGENPPGLENNPGLDGSVPPGHGGQPPGQSNNQGGSQGGGSNK